jgi:hypothetical protein
MEAARRDDDCVVRAMPDRVRLAIPVFETPTACAGAVGSYALRRIAYRAGAYAPGIDEAIFHELHTPREGGTLDDLDVWLTRRTPVLQALGYRLDHRAVTAPLPELLAWIVEGRGYRGAVLATSYEILHPTEPCTGAGEAIRHAVGITVEGGEAGGDGHLVMIDPWPRTGERRQAVAPALERAHRERAHHAIALHWIGWS